MNIFRIILIVTLLMGFLREGMAQLPRRAFLGVKLTAYTAPGTSPDATGGSGVRIEYVFPQSTGAAAGLQAGDILQKINDTPVSTPAEAVTMIRKLRTGDATLFTYKRADQVQSVKVPLQAYPQESAPGLETLYESVSIQQAALRTIITRPLQPGRHPAVLFITGASCYSVDLAQDTAAAEVQLARQLSRAGYVVMRVERPGLGDSQGGTPCEQCDFNTEAYYFMMALKALKARTDVDPRRVFIFGHSMGGVLGPMIAQQEPVAGIAAYGTMGRPFAEYLLAATREQAVRFDGMRQDSIERYVRMMFDFTARFLTLHQSMEQILKERPAYQEVASTLGFRVPGYFWQLHDLPVARNWQTFSGQTLILWGEYDYVSHPDEGETIKQAIDQVRPGRCSVVTIPRTDHDMDAHASFAEMLADTGNTAAYNPAIGQAVLKWMSGIK
ncbi:MAG: alpha/beta fold hydrolase [Bacteroidia bacterium]|nr:alpha/beta fold hydrolase [Bacteroidia bacterium]